MEKSSSKSLSMALVLVPVHTLKPLFSFLLPLSLLLGLLLLHHQPLPLSTFASTAAANPSWSSSCTARYIYIHQMPDRFNSHLLRQCRNLSVWTNMCWYLSNSGTGPRLTDAHDTLIPPNAWYDTHQFALEVLFHNRMKQYDCLTENSAEATAIYVPYYVGLDIGRHLWGQIPVVVRDTMMNDALHWLRSTPEWAARGGRDHFIVSGRTTWDMRRATDYRSDWGGKFMLMPETRNMTVLDIESNKWKANEFAIPYPTYFHPSKEADIIAWEDKVRHVTRPYLFSFAGARRKNLTASGIRDQVIEQCVVSPGCGFLDCGSYKKKCESPSEVMGLFLSSMFCLQPQGDSLTRKSMFDSMLAGCIPVFFHPGTAYQQYRWHLPRDYEKYSVYIPEEDVLKGAVEIQEVLLQYSVEQIEAMREKVIKMMPTLVYNDASHKIPGVRDAFDIAIDRVIQRNLQLISTS